MYESTAEILVRRIIALIPDHPEILEMDSPWDLFKIDEFKSDDLQPSFYQASWALGQAIRKYKVLEEVSDGHCIRGAGGPTKTWINTWGKPDKAGGEDE